MWSYFAKNEYAGPYFFIKEVYNPGRQTGCMRHHDYSAARQHEPRHIQDIGRQTLSK